MGARDVSYVPLLHADSTGHAVSPDLHLVYCRWVTTGRARHAGKSQRTRLKVHLPGRALIALSSLAGLTYHDAIAETGIYSKAVGRLPPDMQEARQVRNCATLHHVDASLAGTEIPHTPTRVADHRITLQTSVLYTAFVASIASTVTLQRRIKRATDLSQKHVEIPAALQEDPFREYKQVNEVFAATQMEHDERRALNNQWWMPYHLGRETWHQYDTKKAWFWNPKKIAGKK